MHEQIAQGLLICRVWSAGSDSQSMDDRPSILLSRPPLINGLLVTSGSAQSVKIRYMETEAHD